MGGETGEADMIAIVAMIVPSLLVGVLGVIGGSALALLRHRPDKYYSEMKFYPMVAYFAAAWFVAVALIAAL